jgi:hypothetical protein
MEAKKIKVIYRGYYNRNTVEAKAILIPKNTILYVDSIKQTKLGVDYHCNYNGIDVIIEDVNATILE